MVGPRRALNSPLKCSEEKRTPLLSGMRTLETESFCLKVTGLFFPENGRSGKRTTLRKPSYSQLEGYGELALNYEGFQDLHLRAQLIFLKALPGEPGFS